MSLKKLIPKKILINTNIVQKDFLKGFSRRFIGQTRAWPGVNFRSVLVYIMTIYIATNLNTYFIIHCSKKRKENFENTSDLNWDKISCWISILIWTG